MSHEDPFWVESARGLARLFEQMPDVNPSALGNDAQKFLASYVPTGPWDKRSESRRNFFADMEEKAFRGVYQTYLSERDKPGFINWRESS